MRLCELIAAAFILPLHFRVRWRRAALFYTRVPIAAAIGHLPPAYQQVALQALTEEWVAHLLNRPRHLLNSDDIIRGKAESSSSDDW